jgi:bis(5'-nucleosidyl)-tetraphosphatase
MSAEPESVVKSCGFLIIRGNPIREFLLMRHDDRWDLPKGHVDPGETDMQCALRELAEETGITADDIDIVPNFRFTLQYQVRDKYTRGPADKTLVIFLARLQREVKIQATEHVGFQWFPWNPPHRIQSRTIDPVLAAVADFLAAG